MSSNRVQLFCIVSLNSALLLYCLVLSLGNVLVLLHAPPYMTLISWRNDILVPQTLQSDDTSKSHVDLVKGLSPSFGDDSIIDPTPSNCTSVVLENETSPFFEQVASSTDKLLFLSELFCDADCYFLCMALCIFNLTCY